MDQLVEPERPLVSEGDAPRLSFVIPARNEARLIGSALQSVHDAVRGRFDYEIIVVDNASTDGTPEIAARSGALVLKERGGTIGAMRNRGVARATGDIIVFIDADVLLTAEWAARFPAVAEQFEREPLMITGSICSVPSQPSWIERYWFAPRSGNSTSHVGTGHMILTRSFFQQLAGFDESLNTGEDYDISQRARAAGASIVIDDALKAEHWGFPRTLAAFIRREIWHGASDFRSLRSVTASRVAIMTLLFVALHVALLAGFLLGESVLAAGAALGIIGVCFVSALHKYRDQPAHVIAVDTLIFYAYYVGRAASAVRARGMHSSPRRGPA